MPTTRSQASKVVDEDPASPNVNASASASTSVPVPTNARLIATGITAVRDMDTSTASPRNPATAIPERRSRAPSIGSQRSTASATARIRKAELDAELQLAEIRRQELQLQAKLIKKRLMADVAAIHEETERESVTGEEVTDTERCVQEWLQHSRVREEGDRGVKQGHAARHEHAQLEAEPRLVENYAQRDLTPQRSQERGIERLADTLEQMMRRRTPSRQTQDLPVFSGATDEWLPFKAAMRESSEMHGFSPAENLARLRGALKGEARQMVSALLYTASEPAKIMKTLEQCYGRPEIILDKAVSDMHKLPRIGTSAAKLNDFAVKLQNIVTIIAGMDQRGYLSNPMLTRTVTEKLTPHLRSKWCDFAEETASRTEPEIVTLSEFLMREADRAIRYAYTPPSQGSVTRVTAAAKQLEMRPRRTVRDNRGVKVYAATEERPPKTCYCCGSEHMTIQCRKLQNMTVPERWEWAKEANICFTCLDSKHRRFHCKGRKCGVNECRQPHHALLHVTKEDDRPSEERVATTAATPHASMSVLLKVCPVTVRGPKGTARTYALFDEGSTVTLMDEAMAKTIGAVGPQRAINIHGVTSSQRGIASRIVDIAIKGRNRPRYHDIQARTIKGLTLGQQTVGKRLLEDEHLRRLCKKDVCYSDAKPTILIGTDNWHLIVTRKLLTGAKGTPAASLTTLGWVVHGTSDSVERVICRDDSNVLHVRTRGELRHQGEMEDLHDLVKSHFQIDAIGITPIRKPVTSEERAIEIVERTIRRADGQFERKRNARDFRDSHPLAYAAITQNHYMDDWVDSVDDEEVAARTMAEVQEVHSRAGFELAGWGCNDAQLLEHIPEENRTSAPRELGASVHEHGRTLGMYWLAGDDQLAFNTTMHRVPSDVRMNLRPPTKREALRAVMSMFDPLGLLSPYTITAKIMLQGLWKLKMGWDESVPEDEAATFLQWRQDKAYISDLRRPYDTRNEDAATTELHVFCDASEQAYTAVAYWRRVHTDGSVHVTLVAGKAKVAPIRAQTIPRLELQAALIGARLASGIAKEHRARDFETILWTDSTTALHWIRNDSAKYAPYVAHRLGEIAELTKVSQWKWVSDRTQRGGRRNTDRKHTTPRRGSVGYGTAISMRASTCSVAP